MKRILKHVLSLILFLSNFNNVECQQRNDFNRLINKSVFSYMHNQILYYWKTFNGDTIKKWNDRHIEISNYPPDFKLDINIDLPTYFNSDYDTYNMRRVLRRGYVSVRMFDIRLCKDTLMIGFNNISFKTPRRAYITDNQKNFFYKYDNVNQKWDSLAILSGWWNFNHRRGEFLHNDLYDIYNECLYSYLVSPKYSKYAIDPSVGFYLLLNGMSKDASFLEQRIVDMNCSTFLQANAKYRPLRAALRTKKGFDAVALEDLVLSGDTLKISYAWRNVKLLKRKKLSVDVDTQSKKTYYYKYSSEREKWEFIKEE